MRQLSSGAMEWPQLDSTLVATLYAANTDSLQSRAILQEVVFVLKWPLDFPRNCTCTFYH